MMSNRHFSVKFFRERNHVVVFLFVQRIRALRHGLNVSFIESDWANGTTTSSNQIGRTGQTHIEQFTNVCSDNKSIAEKN